jgi:hypothetical protein
VVTDETRDGVTDIEETKADGSAVVRCFAARDCQVEAKLWLTWPGQSSAPEVAASLIKQIEAGNEPVTMTLVLTEKRSEWELSSPRPR